MRRTREKAYTTVTYLKARMSSEDAFSQRQKDNWSWTKKSKSKTFKKSYKMKSKVFVLAFKETCPFAVIRRVPNS